MNKKMFLYLSPTAYVQKFPKAKLLKKFFLPEYLLKTFEKLNIPLNIFK